MQPHLRACRGSHTQPNTRLRHLVDMALSTLCFALAVLSKSAAIALPIAFPLIDLIAAVAAAERSDQPLTRHLHIGATILRLLPSALVAVAMLAVTTLANVEGEDVLCDTILIPSGLPRFLKACMVVCAYMLKMVYPVGLRPHYKIDPRELQLGLFATGDGSGDALTGYTTAARTAATSTALTGGVGAASVLGAPSVGTDALCAAVWVVGLTVALGADALCYLADSAMAEEGNDCALGRDESTGDGSTDGGGGSGGGGSGGGDCSEGAFLLHRHSPLSLRRRGRRAASLSHAPFGRSAASLSSTTNFSSAVSSVALFSAWVFYAAMFVPTCGIIQHGMVSMGADR
jgi:hypothetical protein